MTSNHQVIGSSPIVVAIKQESIVNKKPPFRYGGYIGPDDPDCNDIVRIVARPIRYFSNIEDMLYSALLETYNEYDSFDDFSCAVDKVMKTIKEGNTNENYM